MAGAKAWIQITHIPNKYQTFTSAETCSVKAVPWLRRLVAGLSPGSVHVGFVVDKVALGQVCPRVLPFSPVNFIPPVIHCFEKRKTNHLHHRVAQ
jgi:hypothetical protein